MLRVGAATATATAQPGISSVGAQATVDALAVSLFGGEITAETINVRASAAAGRAGATGDVGPRRSRAWWCSGQPVTATPGTQIPLADWGTLDAPADKLERTDEPPRPRAR